jgi:hypothetical protein
MGIFAALMTYLVAAALLVGGMVTGFSVLFSQPTETSSAAKAPPPLIRAADRKAPEPPKAFAPPQSAAATPGPAVNPVPADPLALSNAKRAKQLASQSVRKKKVANPAAPAATPEPDTATLGYGPSEWPPRKFIFPLDPGW